VAQVVGQHGEILLEYGQIIERPKMKTGNIHRGTPSEELGNKKLMEAFSLIKNIEEEEEKQHSNSMKRSYTFQKTEIHRIRASYLKSKAIEKEEARKLAIIKSDDDSVNKLNLSVDRS
jgi:hypothetical protein